MRLETETECRFCTLQIDGEPCEKVNHCRRNVRVCESYVPTKKVYFKLPPELADGEHWTVVERMDEVVDAVKVWCEEFSDHAGESITIETIEMTLAEVDALPDI